MAEQRRPGRYPREMRDRAVRMVFEAERSGRSQWEAIVSVADKLGPTRETIRRWVRQVEVDEGENMKLAGRYQVRGFPTVLLIQNGREVARFSGAKPLSFLRHFLEENLDKNIKN